MNLFADGLTPFTATTIAIIAAVIFLVVRNELKFRDKVLSDRDKILRVISVALNAIWLIALIPVIGLCLFAGLATIMMMGSGNLNSFYVLIISVSTLLFWATPVAAIIGVILSSTLRKRDRYVFSVIVQFIPLFLSLLAFLLLYVTFWLG